MEVVDPINFKLAITEPVLRTQSVRYLPDQFLGYLHFKQEKGGHPRSISYD